MHDAIKLIVAAGLAVPALGGCSGEPNPDQNVVITENVPADAEIEALPVDEGGGNAEVPDDGNSINAY
jgi:hypothetical protein